MSVFEEEEFLPVLDLWIAQKDFLHLKFAYDNLPFARAWINRNEKLEALSTTDFYLGYSEYLRELVDISDLDFTLKLAVFLDDCLSLEIIVYKVMTQILAMRGSKITLIVTHQKYLDLFVILASKVEDSKCATVLHSYEKILHTILRVCWLNITAMKRNDISPSLLRKFINYERTVAFELLRKGKYRAFFLLYPGDHNTSLILSYLTEFPEDENVYTLATFNIRSSEDHLINASELPQELKQRLLKDITPD
jgi:hypothetical protein